MSNPTAYIRISSGDIGLVKRQSAGANFAQSKPAVNFHQPQVEPWRERLEREMLENARRDATRGERSAAEQALWNQVSGKASASVQPSAQLQSDWARFQATRTQPSRREIELEAKLFEQVAETGPRRRLGGDSSRFAGKPGL